MSRQAYAEVITYVDDLTGALKPAVNAEVFVYKPGTVTLATIFNEREGGSPASNPFIVGSQGLALFWGDTADYDIKFHDTELPARFGDYTIGWTSSPVNVQIDAGELSNEGDVTWTQEGGGAWVAQLKSGVVGLTELASSAFFPASRLDAAAQTQLFASGDIKASAKSAAPSGWLLCNGASLLRSEYANLFTAIGTAFGAADGTHFNVPNLSGRSPVGVGTPASGGVSNRVLGASGGEETHVLSTSELANHTHSNSASGSFSMFQNAGVANGIQAGRGGNGFPWDTASVAVGVTIGYEGGNAAHNTMHPFQVVNFFIKT